ncbi:diaminopimelate epimerase [Romboutsia sedimentorum]|uniref:Diaminopimelate epimerase n=1 Tax=Romboutsia sedimentorum TaxID=1368474 RepID=A0ABT7EBA2_9FIRM|nr:diaminopimelate epimerase [Romboutsia sedimentorum]MDK2564206.1 diaminopimelate epimerase [Romboutsia sedimentorum]
MIKFQKFQGTGNDFIIFKESDLKDIDYSSLAKKVCNRNFGIGADGMIVVAASNNSDVKMCFYNADGSIATMCGNGIRCFSKFVYENSIVNNTEFSVETLAGIMKIKVSLENDKVAFVDVNLGRPLFVAPEIPIDKENKLYINKEISVGNETFKVNSLVIGTIHTVIFVDDFENIDFERIGSKIENSEIYPMKTNVNFCKIIDKENIDVVTWEKGVGITKACGTGAAASAIISSIVHDCSKKVKVKVKGGELFIEQRDGEAFLIGPTEYICSGEYNYYTN